jgi:hypothetical protein
VEPQAPMPMRPQRRRRRTRRKKTTGEVLLKLAKGATPLLLVAALALITAGVVRVVETGAASQANRREGVRPRMATARPVNGRNQALRPINQPMRNDAMQMLNGGNRPTGNPKVKTVTPKMQDQILDWGLLEDARKQERAEKKRDEEMQQQLGALLEDDPDPTLAVSP